MTLISTKLPDVATFSNKPPELHSNTILVASTYRKYYYPEHKTPYLFISNFHAKGHYIANQQRIEVSERNFYFLNKNDDLEIHFKENVKLQTLFILFNADFIKDSASALLESDEKLLDTPHTSITEVVIPTVPYPYNTSISEKISLLTKFKCSKETLDILLFELITDIFQLIHSTQKSMNRLEAKKKATKEEIYRRIFMAIEMMNDSLTEKKTLDAISKAVYMNKFHFLANFKSITGATPHQYFIQLKLQKAFELLQSKQYSVSEVCSALDFDSIGSFSNLFKSKFLNSPSKIPNFR